MTVHRLVGVLLAVSLAATGLVLASDPAVAGSVQGQVHAVRPGADLVLVGRGYGHGRGMSQWGARGAATIGLGYQQILGFYYPGTWITGQPDTEIRVWLRRDDDSETRVVATAGQLATTEDGTVALPTVSGLGGPLTRWRALRAGSGVRVEGYDGANGRWLSHVVTPSGRTPVSVTFSSAAGAVRLVLPDGTLREYRGAVRAILHGAGELRSLAVLPMEQYLRSVVPAEMPASWPAESLRAQAVGARSYASWERSRATGAAYDTCDDTACQVFTGTASYSSSGALLQRYEHASTDAAIAATPNQVLVHGTSPAVRAMTQFSAANGGWTADGGQSYLPAQPDPYDGIVPSAAHSWRATVTAAAVAAAYPSLGRLRTVDVTDRDGRGHWGGRASRVVLVGTDGRIEVSAAAFRTTFGLRSTWWTLAGTSRRSSDWDGDGNPDVLARQPDGRLWLYRGDGAGWWSGWGVVNGGWQTMDAVVPGTDLDDDGDQDLLARAAEDGALWLYPSGGDGSWQPRRRVGVGFGDFDQLLVPGDWSGDRCPDLLGRPRGTGALLRYPGDCAGGWGVGVVVNGGWEVMDLIASAGDFDLDGSADLVAREAATGALWLYRGDGAGGWASRRWLGGGWQTIDQLAAPGDWDGDGLADLLGRERGTGRLYLYSGDGAGAWRGKSLIGSGWQAFDWFG